MFSVFEYVLIAVYVAVLLVVSRWIGQQAFSWMPPQATAEAQRVDDLFSFLVSIGAFILLGLIGVMVYAIAFHRAPPEDYTEGHPSRGDTKLEILWTATPTLLVVWIAFQSFNIYQQLDILGLKQIVHLHTPLESAPAYVPLMIGARDMAFPLLNAISFWILPPAGLLLLSSFFLPNGTAQSGWWSYPPISLQIPGGELINGEFIWIVSLVLIGISSIMGAVNFVTTIFWMRAPGMTFFRMPVFVWSVLSAQLLQLINLPALTGALILLLLDLSVGTQFFKPDGNGDPIIYQHLFWFYSHPAVYIMALPAFGIFAEIFESDRSWRRTQPC